MKTAPLLTRRQLGRATLARQMLLARASAAPEVAVEQTLGLQAQLARPPYIGLWSRIEGFRREALTDLLARREVVRGSSMRGTLHLHSARDYLWLRPTMQPMLSKAMRSVLRERADALDIAALVSAARELLASGPRTFEDIRDHLTALGLAGDERARGFAVRTHVALVQVPDGGTWAYPPNARFALADGWVGAAVNEPQGDPRRLVRRYLAAFGPASISDAQVWSGLASLRDAFEGLRPELTTFRDERGRELFDLPDAPRPPEDSIAPVRFLPDFDNFVLGHDDRSRLIEDAHRPLVSKANLRVLPTFLVDGMVAGTWDIERVRGTGTLSLSPFGALSKKARAEIEEEGDRLVRFVEPDAKGHAIQWEGAAPPSNAKASASRAAAPKRPAKKGKVAPKG